MPGRAHPQIRTLRQEESSTPALPLDLSELQLDPARRAELESALKQRDYKRAETILIEESEGDAKSTSAAKALTIAGGIFFLDGQFLNSAIAWKRAEAITPLDDRSRFTLAMAYVKLDRRDWARPELEKLAAAQPANPLYLYWLARLDYDAQNYNGAIDRLQKVLNLDPKMMRAYDTLGLCYDYQGKFDQAVSNFNAAIELNRQQPKPSAWPHVDLAVSLISLNQLSEAEKTLREALGYDPGLPQAHYQLGRVLEMRGDLQSAVKPLQQAAALSPFYPEPHLLLGRIYHKLGQPGLAQSEINQFQKLKQSTEASSQPKPESAPN